MKYSNFAHIPWALFIMALAIVLHVFGVPISFIGAAGGAAVCISRSITKTEYDAIINKFGGLRANMPSWYAFNPAHWNTHTKLETVYAIVAAFAVAVLVHLFALRLIGIAL